MEKIIFEFTPFEATTFFSLLTVYNCNDPASSTAINDCVISFRSQYSKKALSLGTIDSLINKLRSKKTKEFIFEFSPFEALTISTLFSFWDVNDPKNNIEVSYCLKEFKYQLTNKLTQKQFEDAMAEYAVNKLLGRNES